MQAGKAVVVCIGSLVVALEPAWAQEMGARATGRAGAFRADPTDAAGAPENLAALATAPRYDVYAGASLGADDHFGLRAGAIDTRTSAVSLAAGYHRITDDVPPEGDELPGWSVAGEELDDPTRHEGAHLGLAVPLLQRRLAIGAVARYDWRESDLSGKDTAFNIGANVAARPWEPLVVAVGARDLLDSGYADTGRSADLAVRWEPGPFVSFSADGVLPLSGDISMARAGWHAGADASLVEWLALRGGYARDAGANEIGVGAGVVSEKVTLDYGVRVVLGDEPRSWHALDLRVFF